MRALWTLVPLIGLAWGQGLDLATLLRLLPQSPGWQALEAQYAQAQASYQAALAALGLKVAASGGLAYQSLQGQANTRESLSLSANLLALPYGPAQESARQARMALLRADLSRRSGEMDLLFTLLQQYWGAYLAEKNLEVAQRALAVAQEAYRVAQAKRLQGLLSETGLKQAAQALAQAQAALVQAQTQEAAARTALYATLGQAPGPPPPQDLLPPTPPPPPPLEEALRAVAGRPEVLRAQNALEDARQALAYAEAARFLPQGTLSLSYGQLSAANPGSSLGLNLNLGTGQVSVSATYVPGGSGAQGLGASLSLSFPLLAPDLEAQVAAARANLAYQQANLASTVAAAEADIRARHGAYLAALAQLEAAQKGLEAADQVLADARKRLEAGLIAPLDLAQAELSRLQAAYGLTSAQVNAHLAYLALRRSLAQLTLEAYIKEVVP